ncbi:MAG: 50S ribosomal protein L18 [Bacteroidia bacterium]|nr:50S ribosomal protein L18 [Bacteroidia bacterium]
MATDKTNRRERIRNGIRKKVRGTAERPRLAVFRSNSEIYAQVIDDTNGVTLVGASSLVKEISSAAGTKSEKSKLVGMEVARRAKEKGVDSVVFDRGGYKYHGRIKALAEGAREGGLNF